MKSSKSAWELRERDLPPAWMIAREPRLAGLADNAVFRAALWRRRRGRTHETPVLGQIDRQTFIDLHSAGLPADEFAHGIWGAAASRAGSFYDKYIIWASGAAMLAAFVVPSDWLAVLALLFCGVMFFVAIRLATRSFGPAPSLLTCARLIGVQREWIECRFYPRQVLKRELKQAAVVVMAASLIMCAYWIEQEALGLLAHASNWREPLPLAWLVGPAFAGIGALAGRFVGWSCRRRAQRRFSAMVDDIEAALRLLRDDDALVQAGILDR